MPKVKAPCEKDKYKAVGGGMGDVECGNKSYYFSNDWDAMSAANLANEAYAHGYRNGVRAGRNMK